VTNSRADGLLQQLLAQTVQSRPDNPAAQSSSKSDQPFSPFPSQTRWTLSLDTAVVGPPVFDGAAAYFPVEGTQIIAYDLSEGALRWKAPGRPLSPPVAGNGLVFVAQTDGIVALTTDQGSVAWTLQSPGKLAAPLVWDHGWLVAATETTLLVFRASDGKLLWSRDTGAPARSTPALAGEAVYLALQDGRVAAFRITDGTLLWERRLGAAANVIRALEDRLLVGSSDNYLYCFDAMDGETRWRWRTGADVVSMPIIDEHRVYFVSLDNVLRALNLSNGVQQWKRALPFRPQWGPIKAADTLIVTGLAGPAHAFFAKDGKPAGDLNIGSGVELAARPHAFDSPLALGPIIVTVTRGLSAAATVTASSRSIEPPLLNMVLPLPGLITVTAPVQR
jgi:outer membrane protein assembly factor BamB